MILSGRRSKCVHGFVGVQIFKNTFCFEGCVGQKVALQVTSLYCTPLYVASLYFKFSLCSLIVFQTNYKRHGNTTRRKRRKAAPSTGEGGQAVPPNKGEGRKHNHPEGGGEGKQRQLKTCLWTLRNKNSFKFKLHVFWFHIYSDKVS